MKDLLTDLARLYEYPGPGYRALVARITDRAGECEDDVYLPMRRFFEAVATMGQAQLEELFTTTFDLNPSCNPEVGWHIWGEDYNRGAFMAELRDEFERWGIEERGELPDHLVHMLPLLAVMDPNEARPLAERLVLPALAAMRDQLDKHSIVYVDVLRATIAAIQAHTGLEGPVDPPARPTKATAMMSFSGKLTSPRHGGGNDG